MERHKSPQVSCYFLFVSREALAEVSVSRAEWRKSPPPTMHRSWGERKPGCV